jgi:hypothetical protein
MRMTKRPTITVSDDVYDGVHRLGPRNISDFFDSLAREHLFEKQLEADCKEAAADEQREREATAWSESGVDDGLPDEDFSGWPGYPTR